MEKRAIREAECWLKCAERSLEISEYKERFTVASWGS